MCNVFRFPAYIRVEGNNMEQPTKQLINDLLEQRRTAQQRLIGHYGPCVFRLVLRIVGQQQDAEEVYQDVFVKVLQNIASYDDRLSTLGTWISRIAYRESISFLRRTRPAFVYIEEKSLQLESLDTEVDDAPRELTIQRLEQAITQLQPQEQALLTMFYYDNLSLRDIAFATDSIPSTVGSWLCRIRKKLYRIIKTMPL